MTIYLYKKTHNKTGLKYLGKTVQNPYKYKGSGNDWIPHIKKYGYDVTTEILKECLTVEELKHWGLYYSELWNVVESDEWANLKPEEGDGFASGQLNPMKDPKMAEKVKGPLNPMFGKSAINEQNLRWYNNGQNCIYVSEGTQPADYVLGRGPWDKRFFGGKKTNLAKNSCIGPDGTLYESVIEAAKLNNCSTRALLERLRRQQKSKKQRKNSNNWNWAK